MAIRAARVNPIAPPSRPVKLSLALAEAPGDFRRGAEVSSSVSSLRVCNPHAFHLSPANSLIRPTSNSPLAPHPVTPAGIAGRNFSYNPNASLLSSSGRNAFASSLIAALTTPSDSPNLLSRYRSTPFASIGLSLFTALTPSAVLIAGTARPQISIQNCLSSLLGAHLFHLLRHRPENPQVPSLRLSRQTRHRLPQRECLVTVKSHSLGNCGRPQRQHGSTIDQYFLFAHAAHSTNQAHLGAIVR